MNHFDAKGKALTKDEEKCRLNAYPDGKGIATIGWGSIWMPNGERVKMGDTITQQEADVMFDKFCLTQDEEMHTIIGFDLLQDKYNAAFDFAYNEGVGNFMHSTLLQKIKADPNDITIPNEFMKWDLAGKEIEGGLVIRRGKEIAMWTGWPLSEVRSKWALLDEELKKQNL